MLRHHLPIFLLLNFLVLYGYCMFNPMAMKKGGACVDVKAYFAVDNEESNEESSDDDFYHVENLKVTVDQNQNSQNQKNENAHIQIIENSQNSQNQKNQNSLAQNSQISQNSQNQKSENAHIQIIQNSQNSQNSQIQNSQNLKSDVSICSLSNGNCEPGWKNFTRPSGEWCMKIFYEDSLTHNQAAQRCEAQGAALSGLQNQIEAQYVFSTVTIGIYPGTGSIWIGLKRKKECEGLGWTVNCTWDKAFEWTDKSATGTDGLNWACNQPDNARNRSQNCATLTASSAGNVLGFQTGTIDDVGCDFDYIKENRKERNIRAYVCGKKSKV